MMTPMGQQMGLLSPMQIQQMGSATPVPTKPGQQPMYDNLIAYPARYDPSMDNARYPFEGEAPIAKPTWGPAPHNPNTNDTLLFDHEMGMFNPRPNVPMNPNMPMGFPPSFFAPRQPLGQGMPQQFGGVFGAPMQLDFFRQLFAQLQPQRGMQKPMML